MGKRQDDKVFNMRRIGETALRLFFENGYEQTKMKEIADEAGVSVGLVFHYFNSKEDIYNIIIRQGSEDYVHISEQLQDYTEDAYQTLFDTAVQLLQLLDSHVKTTRTFFLIENADDRIIDESIAASRTLISERTVALIIQGQREGKIRKGNARLLAAIYWDSFKIFSKEYGLDQSLEVPAAEWFMDILKRREP